MAQRTFAPKQPSVALQNKRQEGAQAPHTRAYETSVHTSVSVSRGRSIKLAIAVGACLTLVGCGLLIDTSGLTAGKTPTDDLVPDAPSTDLVPGVPPTPKPESDAQPAPDSNADGSRNNIESAGSYTFTTNTTLSSATTYDYYDITINPGVTLTIHGTHSFASVNNQGTLSVSRYDGTGQTGTLLITANTFTSSGSVDSSGKGYGGGGGGGASTYEANSGAGGSARAGAGGGGGGGTSTGYSGYCPTGGAGGVATEGGSSGSPGIGGCGSASYPGGNGGANANLVSGGVSVGEIAATGAGGGPFGGTGMGGSGSPGNPGGYLATATNGDTSTDFTTAIGGGGSGGSGGCGAGMSAGGAGEGVNGGGGGGAKGANVSAFGRGNPGGGGGGSGGGSIRINAMVSISISGTFRANGGAGGITVVCNGGAGAGGGIAINAPVVNLTGATVESLGGGLLSGGTTTNGGTIKIFTNAYTGSTRNTTSFPSGRVYSGAFIP